MRRAILMLAFVMGCSTAGRPAAPGAPPPPQVVERPGATALRVERDRTAIGGTVSAPVDQVWNIIGSVYRQLGIETTTVLSDTYTIGNQSLKVRRVLAGTPLSRYLDCGAGTGIGPNADYYNIEMSILTQLSPNTSGGTNIRSVVDATATPVSLGTNPVVCSSTSMLERRIATMLQEGMSK